MVQQESDLSNILHALLDTDYAKLVHFSMSIDRNSSTMWSIHGPMNMHVQNPTAELALSFYLDQTKLVHQDIYLSLEKHLHNFLQEVNGVFTHRQMDHRWANDKSSPIEIIYKLKLYNSDEFFRTIEKLYIDLMDKKFTEALESKLSED